MPRITTSLAIAALLGACTVPGARVRAVDGATFSLAPGETARLADGGGLRYERLVADSRCPPAVQCVWAGDAVIALRWLPSSGVARELQLHLNTASGPDHADFDGHRVTFVALGRQDARANLTVMPTP